MSDLVHRPAEETSFVLPGIIDRKALPVLRDELVLLLERGSGIAIDAGKVEQIGQAGFQLLLSVVRTARERGLTIQWTFGEPIANLIRLAGLDEHFPLAANAGRQA